MNYKIQTEKKNLKSQLKHTFQRSNYDQFDICFLIFLCIFRYTFTKKNDFVDTILKLPCVINILVLLPLG